MSLFNDVTVGMLVNDRIAELHRIADNTRRADSLRPARAARTPLRARFAAHRPTVKTV